MRSSRTLSVTFLRDAEALRSAAKKPKWLSRDLTSAARENIDAEGRWNVMLMEKPTRWGADSPWDLVSSKSVAAIGAHPPPRSSKPLSVTPKLPGLPSRKLGGC